MGGRKFFAWLSRELGGKERWSLFLKALRKGDLGAISYMLRMWFARNLGRSTPPTPPPIPGPVQIAPNPLNAPPRYDPPARQSSDILREEVLVAELLSRLNHQHAKVSVIIPCYNYGAYVAEAVGSCLRQSYANLEIIVVNDGSTDGKTLDVLRTLEGERVVVVDQPNMGLSLARNNGAARATGDFLVFLDADDTLDVHALALLLYEFVQNPALEIVYPYQHFFGDEDVVWACQEFNAYDLHWSAHVSVCLMIRRDAFEKSKKYQPSMKYGYEDWEFALGCAGQNRHIGLLPLPVFNHRRHGRTMTAEAHDKKDFLYAQLYALNSDLFVPERLTSCKLASRPLISVIIPYYNGHRYIDETLGSLSRQTTDDYEIILVNDGSNDDAALRKLKEIAARGGVTIVHKENRGLSSARNRGALEARGDFLLFLDPDDILEPGFCEKLAIKLCLSPHLAFVYSGVIHFGDLNGTEITEFDLARLKKENYIAFTTLIRRTVFLLLGGMDEEMHDNFEDYDFWLRLIEQGYTGSLVYEPLFRYRRHGGGKMAKIINSRPAEDRQRELQKRHPFLYGATSLLTPPKPLARPGSIEKPERLLADFQSFYRDIRLGGDVKYLGYRRCNTPNLFSTVYHRSESKDQGKIALLYLIPHMVIGGAERIDLDILRGLDKDTFRIVLVVELQGNHQWYDLFADCVDEMFLCPNFLSGQHQVDAFLDYIIVAKNIDIVFNRNTYSGYRVGKRWCERSKNIRFVDLNHLHNYGEDWLAQAAPFASYLHRRFVTNHDLKEYVSQRYGASDDSMKVIYCGVDTEKWDPVKIAPGVLKTEMKFRSDEKLVGFVGRFDGQKDPFRWLRVAREVRNLDPRFRFVMVGGGPLLDEAMKYAGSLGLAEEVHFTGYQNDILSLVRDFDCLLLVSNYEGLPQVVIEALSLGVPVVSTDAGGTRECVVAGAGRIVPREEEERKIAEVVAEEVKDDTTGRKQFRRKRIIENFSVSDMQNRYAREFKQLAGGLDRSERLREFQINLMHRPMFG
jgi:glycosyltransferase involved in cell wall biosynthesis